MSQNKTAIVTGAGKGIGRGIALALAQENYNVVVADIAAADSAAVAAEISALGFKSLAVSCDVSKKVEVEAMIAAAVKEFGTLDLMANNAGIFPFVPFADMTEENWDKVIDVNLKSVFLCSQAAAKAMTDGGRIINISSIASFVGFAGLAHYCASKGGINALIRVLALELSPRKITVNAVAPGAIETPGASGGGDEVKKQTVAMIPLARMGQPEDIAGAVTFLASDKASYITGQTIIVDGGFLIY